MIIGIRPNDNLKNGGYTMNQAIISALKKDIKLKHKSGDSSVEEISRAIVDYFAI